MGNQALPTVPPPLQDRFNVSTGAMMGSFQTTGLWPLQTRRLCGPVHRRVSVEPLRLRRTALGNVDSVSGAYRGDAVIRLSYWYGFLELWQFEL